MPTAVEYKPAGENNVPAVQSGEVNPGPIQDPSKNPGPVGDPAKNPGPVQGFTGGMKPLGLIGGGFVAIIAVAIIIICFGPRGLVLGLFKPMMTGDEWQTFTCPSLTQPPEPEAVGFTDPWLQPPPDGDAVGLGGPDTMPSSGDTQPPDPDSNAIGDPNLQQPPEPDAVGLGGPDTMPSSGEVNPPDPSSDAIGDPGIQPPPDPETVSLGGPDTMPHSMAFNLLMNLNRLRVGMSGEGAGLFDPACGGDSMPLPSFPVVGPTPTITCLPSSGGPQGWLPVPGECTPVPVTATAKPTASGGTEQPACVPDPNDGVCSACENTDLDSNACTCNNNGVCEPGEGFNCGDCMPTSTGDDGGKRPCPAGAVCP